MLGKAFVLPLVASPVLAVVVGAAVYLGAHFASGKLGISKEKCLCAGVEQEIAGQLQPGGVLTAEALPRLTVAVDIPPACAERYVGTVFGVNAGRLLDGLHFLSAGLVSLARGLNDTPKIAALLLVGGAFGVRWALVAVAVGIAVGGLLNAKQDLA